MCSRPGVCQQPVYPWHVFETDFSSKPVCSQENFAFRHGHAALPFMLLCQCHTVLLILLHASLMLFKISNIMLLAAVVQLHCSHTTLRLSYCFAALTLHSIVMLCHCQSLATVMLLLWSFCLQFPSYLATVMRLGHCHKSFPWSYSFATLIIHSCRHTALVLSC